MPTVCAGGGPGGGPEPFPSGSRKTLSDARDRGTWKPHPPVNSADSPSPCPTERAVATGPSVTGATPAGWRWTLRNNSQANATTRGIDEPAGTLFFGHRANECVWQTEPVAPTPPGTVPVPDPIRITAAEAGVLQTFPADYPWQGNKGQIFSQVGNAVPPRLAAHLLAPHLGKSLSPDDFTLAA